MATAVSVHDVTVVLGHDFKALDEVSADIPTGRITGFIGPSGAGKTTLVRSIVGRQHIQAGTLSVLGAKAGSASLRPRLRYMTQEQSIYADLTPRENLRYFARMLGLRGKVARQAADDALGKVYLDDKATVLVSNLSGGQKQRVSLAIALLGDAELLVLDEPTVGLDPLLREELWTLFRELVAAGKTIIITSHVMDEAERCDELLLVRDGHIVAHGTPAELKQRTRSQTIEQSFLKLTETGS
jgi:ABC-type multidrug transport system ATPase subunit